MPEVFPIFNNKTKTCSRHKRKSFAFSHLTVLVTINVEENTKLSVSSSLLMSVITCCVILGQLSILENIPRYACVYKITLLSLVNRAACSWPAVNKIFGFLTGTCFFPGFVIMEPI